MSRQAYLQRNYAALGARTEHTAATDDGHATASRAADQTPDEPPRHSAQGSGTHVDTGTNTASEPAVQPPRGIPAWGPGHLDYARSEGEARGPNTQAEQVAAQDLDLWITGITAGERLALGVSIPWLLQGLRHVIAIGQHHTHTPPPWATPASGTTWRPGSWRVWGPIAWMK